MHITIPSLYVQQGLFYPLDPSYFVQVVNYVVPRDQNYDIHTFYNFDGSAKSVGKFEDIFKEKITGCAIRLVKLNHDLSFQKPKAYTFTEDYLSKSSKNKQKAKA